MALEKPGKVGEFFSPTLWPQSSYWLENLTFEIISTVCVIGFNVAEY